MLRPVRSQRNLAGIGYGIEHKLNAVGDAELVENAGKVVLDGVLAQVQQTVKSDGWFLRYLRCTLKT